jgi:acetyl esterase/lipase
MTGAKALWVVHGVLAVHGSRHLIAIEQGAKAGREIGMRGVKCLDAEEHRRYTAVERSVRAALPRCLPSWVFRSDRSRRNRHGQESELDRVISMIRARATAPRKTIEEDRLSYETMLSGMTLDDDIATERVGAGGVPAEWICAPGVNTASVTLYLHGGGYVLGSMRTHRVMLAQLSRASGCSVLGLEYRLAPEHPFPTPVEDTLAAYRWLLTRGYDPRKIVLGGDSAGGGLVVAAMVAMRYFGEPLPAAGVCLSPWVDMEATGQSFVTNAASDPSVAKDRILRIASVYLAGKPHQGIVNLTVTSAKRGGRVGR